jgi:hypothetical protein
MTDWKVVDRHKQAAYKKGFLHGAAVIVTGSAVVNLLWLIFWS